MRKVRDLIYPNGKYPVFVIQQSDLTNNVRAACRGFAHSGKFTYLPSILNSELLKCSDMLRLEGGSQIRDKNPNMPNGAGVYYRFVRNGGNEATFDRDIFHASAGVGSTAGVIYFMSLDRGVEKDIVTFNEHDIKYGYPNPDEGTLLHIVNYVKANRTNQSEIAFFGSTRLNDIEKIYVLRNNVSHMSEEVYESFYKILQKFHSVHLVKKADKQMSHNPAPQNCTTLFITLMNILGYTHTTVDVKYETWYKFTRTL